MRFNRRCVSARRSDTGPRRPSLPGPHGYPAGPMSTSSIFQGSFSPEQTAARVFIAKPSCSMCRALSHCQYRWPRPTAPAGPGLSGTRLSCRRRHERRLHRPPLRPGGPTLRGRPTNVRPMSLGPTPRGLPLEISGLTKHFGSVLAVDNLDFIVEPGRVTGFLGPNGSGKTTTLRMLARTGDAERGAGHGGGRLYRSCRTRPPRWGRCWRRPASTRRAGPAPICAWSRAPEGTTKLGRTWCSNLSV